MSRSKMVGVNDKGYRIGGDHPHAKLNDEDVELIRALHEAGLSYRQIAAKFDGEVKISFGLVGQICRYEKRAQVAADWRRVPVKGDGQ